MNWSEKLRTCLPGWIFMAAIAVACQFASGLIVVGGKHPVEAVLLAIIVGMLVRNLVSLPRIFLPGVSSFESVLALGIILLGMALSLRDLVTKVAEAVGVVIVVLLIAPLVIYLLGRWTGLPQKLAILIGVGTTICGGTAIAIAAPVIQAEEEDVSYSIGTIALFGLAAIFVYPLLGHLFHFSSKVFGLWAGTAIHSTPQVLAAGFIFSEEAGQIATVVKLFRNMFMIPMTFLLALWYARKTAAAGQGGSTGVQALRAFPYFLFGFLALVIVRTVGDSLAFIPQEPWKAFIALDKSVAKFLILTAMAGIGLRTDLRSMKSIGYKPFVVGLVGSVILSAVSLVIINVFVA